MKFLPPRHALQILCKRTNRASQISMCEENVFGHVNELGVVGEPPQGKRTENSEVTHLTNPTKKRGILRDFHFSCFCDSYETLKL